MTAVAEPVAAPIAQSGLSSIPGESVAAPVATTNAPAPTTAATAAAGAQPTTTVATTPAPAAAQPTAKRLLGDDAADAKPAPAGEPAKAAPAAEPKAADWSLTIADGSPLSAEDGKLIETRAKDWGLSKDQAEKLLAHEASERVAAKAAAKAATEAQATKLADVWYAEVEADAEIGGAKLPAAVANAKRALSAFATADERKAIASSPFANNPLFLRIMNRAAAALPKEDVVHLGAPPAAEPVSAAETIYGKRSAKR